MCERIAYFFRPVSAETNKLSDSADLAVAGVLLTGLFWSAVTLYIVVKGYLRKAK